MFTYVLIADKIVYILKSKTKINVVNFKNKKKQKVVIKESKGRYYYYKNKNKNFVISGMLPKKTYFLKQMVRANKKELDLLNIFKDIFDTYNIDKKKLIQQAEKDVQNLYDVEM
jgi:hypothetical protein